MSRFDQPQPQPPPTPAVPVVAPSRIGIMWLRKASPSRGVTDMQGCDSRSRSQGCTVAQPPSPLAASSRRATASQDRRDRMATWWLTVARPSMTLLALLALVGCATTKGKAPAPPTAERLPAIALPDLDGRARGLDEFTGRVVLLDFWATWCTPCLESLPVYAELQAELGERGFTVVAINVDDPEEPIADFAERFAPGVLVLLDPEGTVPPQVGLKVMPTAWLLDREGNVRARKEGFQRAEAEELRTEILELLGSEPTPPEEPAAE